MSRVQKSGHLRAGVSRNLIGPRGTGYKILLLLRPWEWALPSKWLLPRETGNGENLSYRGEPQNKLSQDIRGFRAKK